MAPVVVKPGWEGADQSTVPFGNDVALTLVSRRTGNYQVNPEWGVLLDQLWVR